jgi:hypothetical protein
MKGRLFRYLVLAIFLASSFVVPTAGYAATLTSASLRLTRDQVSTAANHEYRFTTPTGVDAPTDTITFTFGTGFIVSSITASDIDLFHGATTGLETEEAVAATAAAGVWGASVSGQVLTLTPPTDAAIGEITAGQKVILRIGTNASGGTNQITNPASQRSYTIVIGGVFGDSLTLLVPISSNDTIAVSVVVPEPPPGGGNGGGGNGGGGGGSDPGSGGGNTTDGTAPTIFGLEIRNITHEGAEVFWLTDEPANSIVQYGLDVTYASGTVFIPGLTPIHSVFLEGLTSSTLYHVRAISKDATGNTATSPDVTFTTTPPPELPLLSLSDIRVVEITDTSAFVLWETSAPASSAVEFGVTEAYGQTVFVPGLRPTHAIFLSGLAPNTIYHFRVSSVDAQSRSAVSLDSTFRTLGDQRPPANAFDFKAIAGDAQVQLSWVLPPDPDLSHVVVVARTDRFPASSEDGRVVYEGLDEATLDRGLQNGTTYYYAIFSVDGQGNVSSGSLASATPTAPPINNQGDGEDEDDQDDQDNDDTDAQGTATGTVSNGQGTSTLPVVTSTTSSTFPGWIEDATSTQPVVTSTEPIPAPDGAVYALSLSYYTADGGMELLPDALGRVDVPAGSPILLRVWPIEASASPVSGRLNVGSSVYVLAPDAQGYWSTIFVPAMKAGVIKGNVVLDFSNGATAVGTAYFQVRALGQVYEQSLFGKRTGIEGAEIFLYEGDRLLDLVRYGKTNPLVSQRDGLFVALVPRGTYRLLVKKEGYEEKEVTVRTMGNVLASAIELRRIPQGILDIVPRIQNAIDAIRSPETQEVAKEIITPAAIAIAVTNASTAASATSVLAYLRFLFTQPFLLFGRRKRRPWGVVYNALSKQPIDLAVVRLIHQGTSLVIQSRVTDAKGRFSFLVPPGSYRIEATKAGFTFPSAYLKDDKQDGEYTDVYHGERIEVKKDAAIQVNIPLDPEAKEEIPKKVLYKKYARKAQSFVGVAGILASLAALVSVPTLVMAVFFVGQVVMYVVFRRLAIPKKPTNWGVVYEDGSKRALGRVVVRIFSKRFNKLLETQVTDAKGAYGFYADKDVYYVTAEHPEYEKYQSTDLDLRKKEEKVISEDISLKKRNNT